MFSKPFIRIVVLLAFFTLLVGSSVLADDGRINRAPYHFGGDTLYCNEAEGCKLLDKTGHELASWPHDDIAAAFAVVDSTDHNSKVGDGKGTFGPTQLWAVGSAIDGNHKLCLLGFDEWGKANDMCFEVTLDQHYEQAALPVAGEVDHSCDKWSVGDRVQLISDNSKNGEILSIDRSSSTVVFGKAGKNITFSSAPSNYIAKCSEIEKGDT